MCILAAIELANSRLAEKVLVVLLNVERLNVELLNIVLLPSAGACKAENGGHSSWRKLVVPN
jgi:hypothetical protein